MIFQGELAHDQTRDGNSARLRRVKFLRPAVSQSDLSSNGQENWSPFKWRPISVMLFTPHPTSSSCAKYFSSRWDSWSRVPSPWQNSKIPNIFYPHHEAFHRSVYFSRPGNSKRRSAFQSRVYFWKARNKPLGGPNLQSSMIDSFLVGKERWS